MRKKLLTVLAIALVVAVFVGCSNTNNVGKGNTPATEGNGSNDGATEKEKITLTYYTWELKPQTKNQIEAFENEFPHVTIEPVVLVQGDVRASLEKLDISVSAGEKVDIIRLANQDQVLQRAATGMLEPLDNYMADLGLKFEDEYFLNVKLDNKYYTLMDNVSFWMVALNKDKLAEANLEVPTMGWTWEDFRQYSQKLTKGDTYGAYFHTWAEYANIIMVTERLHPYLNKDLTPNLNDESFDYFFNLRKQMETVDKSTKPHADVLAAKLHFTTEFFGEEAAMVYYNSRFIENIADTEKYPHDFVTAFAPTPLFSADGELGSTNTGGEYYAIGQNSNHKQEAFDFIRYMTTEGTKIDNGGLPGWKHADGQAVLTQLINGKEDMFDMESVMHTLYDPRVKAPLDPDVQTSYQSELKKLIENGFNQFILDSAGVEEVKETMMKEANKIAEASK